MTERKTASYVVTMVRPRSAGGDREVSVRVTRAEVEKDGRPDAAERIARLKAARKLYGQHVVWHHDARYPQRGQIMRKGRVLSACTPTVVLHVGSYGIARD